MSIFNKRNALVGFVALKALERRRRRQRNALKLAALGVVSLGIVAGVGAILLRRRGDSELLGFGDEADSDIAGEYVAAGSEPIPAT